jgi:hypothetical protein
MFTRHVTRHLAAHLDGRLPEPMANATERHLRECARCRAEREEIRWAMAALEQLPLVEAPETIWPFIEAASPRRGARPAPWRWAVAAAIIMAVVGIAYRYLQGPRWNVVRLEGSPAVGQVAAGEWIETDARSRVSVEIGRIGFVELSPNTRVRVVAARPGEHRLALARGEIRASISAPPKLFFVDTASGTAVDLGCEYTLHTDENGSGLLRVTRGWVAFQCKGLESLVPAGASCRTRAQAGPGIPYFDDAPERLKEALETGALGEILPASRVRDTLTLWHLLARVEAGDRGRVFDRMAALAPLPAGVSREKALALDPPTLTRWREELAWTW